MIKQPLRKLTVFLAVALSLSVLAPSSFLFDDYLFDKWFVEAFYVEFHLGHFLAILISDGHFLALSGRQLDGDAMLGRRIP